MATDARSAVGSAQQVTPEMLQVAARLALFRPRYLLVGVVGLLTSWLVCFSLLSSLRSAVDSATESDDLGSMLPRILLADPVSAAASLVASSFGVPWSLSLRSFVGDGTASLTVPVPFVLATALAATAVATWWAECSKPAASLADAGLRLANVAVASAVAAGVVFAGSDRVIDVGFFSVTTGASWLVILVAPVVITVVAAMVMVLTAGYARFPLFSGRSAHEGFWGSWAVPVRRAIEGVAILLGVMAVGGNIIALILMRDDSQWVGGLFAAPVMGVALVLVTIGVLPAIPGVSWSEVFSGNSPAGQPGPLDGVRDGTVADVGQAVTDPGAADTLTLLLVPVGTWCVALLSIVVAGAYAMRAGGGGGRPGWRTTVASMVVFVVVVVGFAVLTTFRMHLTEGSGDLLGPIGQVVGDEDNSTMSLGLHVGLAALVATMLGAAVPWVGWLVQLVLPGGRGAGAAQETAEPIAPRRGVLLNRPTVVAASLATVLALMVGGTSYAISQFAGEAIVDSDGATEDSMVDGHGEPLPDGIPDMGDPGFDLPGMGSGLGDDGMESDGDASQSDLGVALQELPTKPATSPAVGPGTDPLISQKPEDKYHFVRKRAGYYSYTDYDMGYSVVVPSDFVAFTEDLPGKDGVLFPLDDLGQVDKKTGMQVWAEPRDCSATATELLSTAYDKYANDPIGEVASNQVTPDGGYELTGLLGADAFHERMYLLPDRTVTIRWQHISAAAPVYQDWVNDTISLVEFYRLPTTTQNTC